MDVYLNGQVPVQFPDNATENDVAAFFQGQKARGGGVWDNAFQIAGMLGQQQQAQAPTVAGQFPVFGNAVGLSQEQFQNMNETFRGVGQQQLQQQQLAQQQQQFNAAQAMEQRAQTQAQLQSEKDRSQQLKLEQQRFQNDQQMEKMRLDREQALAEAKANREQQDKKTEMERGTVASGVGGQQLVRRINPDTGQWEVIPLNEPIFAPRGGGRGGAGAGASGSSIQIQDPETKELVTVQKFNPYGDYIDPKTGKVYPRSAFAGVGGTIGGKTGGQLKQDAMGAWKWYFPDGTSIPAEPPAAAPPAAVAPESGSSSLNPLNWFGGSPAPAPNPTYSRPAMKGIKYGQISDGMKYIGGDPNDPASWESL